jgi:hypothetical protein
VYRAVIVVTECTSGVVMEQIERTNTIVVKFDARCPKASALCLHVWIKEHMKLTEDQVRGIQFDGPKRRVYIKLLSSDKMHAIIRDFGG